MNVALAFVSVGGLAALVHGAVSPNSPLYGPVVGRGSRREKALYLTFDDGPNPTATERILDTLEEHDVPATFFLVGRHVERFPDLARRIAGAGHEIGNHTQHHQKLHLGGPARVKSELETAHRAILSTTGRSPRFFRAPHGYRNPLVTVAARRLGYTVFGWTFGVRDSDRPGAEEIRRRVRARLAPGAIVLLHDGDGYDPNGDRTQTAAALPGILEDAGAAGYAIRRLDELVPAPIR